MKTSLVWFVVAAMAVFAGDCGVAGAAEPMAGPSPEQQAAPQEPATAEPPATPQQKVSPEQQAAAEKSGLPVAITNSIGMKLALIPAGEFLMGSREKPAELARMYVKLDAKPEWFTGEQPQHRVRITKSFYLGMHEVTQEQYERVIRANPSRFKGPQHPVERVRWDDAVSFCDKLSALPEERAADRVYRLPTEAEWEYACRAGSTTRYSYGDDAAGLGDHAWFMENSSITTHPVGQKRTNSWGLYDMHGNVSEWCSDWYGEHTNSPVDDSTGPTTGSNRVVRGGSWGDSATWCRTACRSKFQPNDRRNFGLGFRLAVVPSASQVGPGRPANGAESGSR